MKKLVLPIFCAIFCFTLSGCGLVEGAFKAGLIFALIIVAVIGLIVYLLRLVIKQINKPAILKPNETKLNF